MTTKYERQTFLLYLYVCCHALIFQTSLLDRIYASPESWPHFYYLTLVAKAVSQFFAPVTVLVHTNFLRHLILVANHFCFWIVLHLLRMTKYLENFEWEQIFFWVFSLSIFNTSKKRGAVPDCRGKCINDVWTGILANKPEVNHMNWSELDKGS